MIEVTQISADKKEEKSWKRLVFLHDIEEVVELPESKQTWIIQSSKHGLCWKRNYIKVAESFNEIKEKIQNFFVFEITEKMESGYLLRRLIRFTELEAILEGDNLYETTLVLNHRSGLFGKREWITVAESFNDFKQRIEARLRGEFDEY